MPEGGLYLPKTVSTEIQSSVRCDADRRKDDSRRFDAGVSGSIFLTRRYALEDLLRT